MGSVRVIRVSRTQLGCVVYRTVQGDPDLPRWINEWLISCRGGIEYAESFGADCRKGGCLNAVRVGASVAEEVSHSLDKLKAFEWLFSE